MVGTRNDGTQTSQCDAVLLDEIRPSRRQTNLLRGNMTTQPELEQLCEVGIATLFSGDEKVTNERAVASMVQLTYQALMKRARATNKALMNVTQTISTESMEIGGGQQIIYILTLVGTAVDMELVRQQQREQQFSPRVGRNN